VSVDVNKIVADALTSAKAERVTSIGARATLLAKLQAQAGELATEIAAQLALNASDAADIALLDAKAAAVVAAELKP
jgi:predicted transposase YbfD/YdcC